MATRRPSLTINANVTGQPLPDQQQQQPQPPPSSGIPQLTSVAASIFVPNTIDFSEPVAKGSHSQRLRAALKYHETYSAQVRKNLVALLEREQQRVLRAARVEETTGVYPPRPSIISENLDTMIMNMDVKVDMHNPVVTVPTPMFNVNIGQTPREWAAVECMRLRWAAMCDLAEHDKRTQLISQEYEMDIKRALEDENAAP